MMKRRRFSVNPRDSTVSKTIDAASGLIYNGTGPAGQPAKYTRDASKRVTGVSGDTLVAQWSILDYYNSGNAAREGE